MGGNGKMIIPKNKHSPSSLALNPPVASGKAAMTVQSAFSEVWNPRIREHQGCQRHYHHQYWHLGKDCPGRIPIELRGRFAMLLQGVWRVQGIDFFLERVFLGSENEKIHGTKNKKQKQKNKNNSGEMTIRKHIFTHTHIIISNRKHNNIKTKKKNNIKKHKSNNNNKKTNISILGTKQQN